MYFAARSHKFGRQAQGGADDDDDDYGAGGSGYNGFYGMSSGDYGAGGAGKELTVALLGFSYYFLTCTNSQLLNKYSDCLELEQHSNPNISTRY